MRSVSTFGCLDADSKQALKVFESNALRAMPTVPPGHPFCRAILRGFDRDDAYDFHVRLYSMDGSHVLGLMFNVNGRHDCDYFLTRYAVVTCRAYNSQEGAIPVLQNTFFWKFDTHPHTPPPITLIPLNCRDLHLRNTFSRKSYAIAPPRNANNVDLYIFVTLFSRKCDTLAPPTALCNT